MRLQPTRSADAMYVIPATGASRSTAAKTEMAHPHKGRLDDSEGRASKLPMCLGRNIDRLADLAYHLPLGHPPSGQARRIWKMCRHSIFQRLHAKTQRTERCRLIVSKYIWFYHPMSLKENVWFQLICPNTHPIEQLSKIAQFYKTLSKTY